MNATIATSIRTAIVATVGGAAITLAALGLSAAPASAANGSIQQTCEQNPGAYAAGAVRGVYSTQKSGFDRVQTCKVYDATGKLLGTFNTYDYGFYKVPGPVATPPVKSAR
jgi:hypothetical protein